MEQHRLVKPQQYKKQPFNQPFSSFDFVDKNYAGNDAIRRLFSLARAEEAFSLIIEKIIPVGIIDDENKEITSYYSDFQMAALERISFWRYTTDNEAKEQRTKECIGYAILKHDIVPSIGHDRWHVFEAVFKKYSHPHNCVPKPQKYNVTICNKKIQITGLLYAQQNSLNKACAQVALRSLVSRILPYDISYRKINELASNAPGPLNVSKGLTPPQIRAVLSGLNIKFRDFDYTQGVKGDRKKVPYQKYVYSGIESGSGALVGFRLSGSRGRHIIPFGAYILYKHYSLWNNSS